MFKKFVSISVMLAFVLLSTIPISAFPATDGLPIDFDEIKKANEEYFQLVKSGQADQFDESKREKILSAFEGKPELEKQFIASIEAFKPSNVQVAVNEAAEHINGFEGTYYKQFDDGSFIGVGYELKKIGDSDGAEIAPMSSSYIPLGDYEVTWTVYIEHIAYPWTYLTLKTNMDIKENEIEVWDATAISDYQPPFVNVTDSASILDGTSTSSSNPARTKAEFTVTYGGHGGTGVYVVEYILYTKINHLGYDPRPAYNGVNTEIEHSFDMYE